MSDTISWYYKDNLPEQNRLALEKQTKDRLMKQEDKEEVVELNITPQMCFRFAKSKRF